jgi:cytochrome c biogenesis protein CcmG/thiol:disulfide interchange protein DsbE
MSDLDLGGAIAPPRKGRAALFVAIPMALAMVLLVAVLITRSNATDKAAFTPLQDKPAPEIAGTTLDGKAFDLDAFRGDWVAVNFLASWCVPCLQEHPFLESFARRQAQAGNHVHLVSVVFGDTVDNVKKFFAENGGDWPVVTGDEGRIALDYSVVQVPETYIIDPAGIVRERVSGPLRSPDELDNRIGALITKLYPTDSSDSTSVSS